MLDRSIGTGYWWGMTTESESDERRRRLVGRRFDGPPCHEWPRGDDRNDP